MTSCPCRRGQLDSIMDQKTITVPRTGDRPLTFRGRQLGYAQSWRDDKPWGRRPTRAYSITIYQVGGEEHYVLAIHYETRWESESARDFVLTCQDATAIASVLMHDFDPMYPVRGFPPVERFQAQQQRLESIVRQKWAELVGRVLAQLPESGDAPRV